MPPDSSDVPAEQEDLPVGRGTRAPCPVIGIGTSAGGLDALRKLFSAVPADCDLTFVVIQHLAPHLQSSLPEVIARSSALPVSQIEDGTAVQPGHVYVIPPGAVLTLKDAVLHLAHPESSHDRWAPIDGFFVSLARDQGENAACVILSGSGSDGTLGLRAIKEHEGLTLAQADASYDAMMRSAVGTGLVDYVLKAEDIPARLIGYFAHVTRLADPKEREGIEAEAAEHLLQIAALLRAQTGNDFSGYKNKTVIRRVQRRMQVLQLASVPAFIERLRKDPHEVRLLFQDMLIGVTNFFRDPEVFAAVGREVVPNLFEGKPPSDVIRVWVPGCSTGEEAYTVAMLLREAAATRRDTPKLQIFATDIDDRALDVARLGRYPGAIANDVPPHLLDRYFVHEDGTWRVATELREMCLFSSHNVLRDAPFSRLDMISCRNLMIYLTAELQDRVIPLFHYALLPDGYLVLGTSENVTKHGRLFVNVDKAHRIFRRRPHSGSNVPEFPLIAPVTGRRPPVGARRGDAEPTTIEAVAERLVLDRYAPPYVIINAEGGLIHASGRTGRYLELPHGVPDINLFSMARSGLRLDLRAAVHRTLASGRPTTQRKVAVGGNGDRHEIDIHVQPLRSQDGADTLLMVVFQGVAPDRPLSESESQAINDGTESAGTRQLESELRDMKERLQTTTEELESSNEELRSSNEELSSMNEELQSSNEELETSKEELQSVNEELQTVNAELHIRVEELGRANNDMANLLESTQIATIFLDKQLRVKSFTPAAKDVFHLVESDIGRPIGHVRARISAADTLEEDARRVLRTLTRIERPVTSLDTDALYIMRILPYKTSASVIDGVVLTFPDITRATAAEARVDELTRDLRSRISNLETLLDLIPVGVFIAEDAEATRVLVNRYGARLIGTPTDGKGLRPLPIPLRLLDGDTDIIPDGHLLRFAARKGTSTPVIEARLRRADNTEVFVMASAAPMIDETAGRRSAVAALVDISPHKRAEAQQVLLHELQHRVKNILATVGALAVRMMRGMPIQPEFRDAFLERLAAMGRTHELLSGGAWSGAELHRLLGMSLEPYINPAKTNVVLKGPDIMLPPTEAASLGMVFYELTTNGAKYGALSAQRGVVEVTWEIAALPDGARQVRLIWAERGGPRVKEPRGRGFGTDFIERCVRFELQGTAELAFEPAGVRCAITFPLKHAAE